MTAPVMAVLAVLQFDSVPKPRPVLAVAEAALINVFVNRLGSAVTRHESFRLLGV